MSGRLLCAADGRAGALPGSSRQSGGVSGGVSAWDLVQPGPVGRRGLWTSQVRRLGMEAWSGRLLQWDFGQIVNLPQSHLLMC